MKYFNHDFGEGHKLYSCTPMGSSYHFHHVEKQPNGTFSRVLDATEFNCGYDYYMKHFGKSTPNQQTTIRAGV